MRRLPARTSLAQLPHCSGSSRRGTLRASSRTPALAPRRFAEAKVLPPRRGSPAVPPPRLPPRSAHASSPRPPLPPQWSAGWVTQEPPPALTALGRRGLPERSRSISRGAAAAPACLTGRAGPEPGSPGQSQKKAESRGAEKYLE